jgi:hypothetical protein
MKASEDKQIRRLLRLYPFLRRVSRSGSGFFKLDLDGGDFKFELKATRKESYSLRLSDLKKLEGQAKNEGKLGAMILTFQPSDDDYLIVNLKDFFDLVKWGLKIWGD